MLKIKCPLWKNRNSHSSFSLIKFLTLKTMGLLSVDVFLKYNFAFFALFFAIYGTDNSSQTY